MRVKDYVVVDLETTGLSAKIDKIMEIGAVKVRNGKIVDTYVALVNPKTVIPQRVVELTGITNEMVENGDDLDESVQKLLTFMGDDILVGHNIGFDYSFIKQWATNHKIPLEKNACDTLKIARLILPPEQSKKLEALCEFFKIRRENAHRALDDAVETWEVFEKLQDLAVEKGIDLPEAKPLIYKAKKQTPATKHQKERLKEYIEKKDLNGKIEQINWETLTRSQASRIHDILYATYGR